MTNTTFIKVDALFLALGYTKTSFRGQATRVFQKALGMQKELAQATFVLTEKETKTVLMDLVKGKSKNKNFALELLNDDNFLQVENILTEDDTYTGKTKKVAKKKAITKALMEEFLEEQGLTEELKEWFKNRVEA
jgi:hypothetical protein